MTHPIRFLLTREHWWGAPTPLLLMGCTDPLRRGVGAPHQCLVGVGGKLPLLLDADVHTF